MLKRFSGNIFALLLMSIAPSGALAQVTAADYQRADSIMKLNDLVYLQVNRVNWIDSTSNFWYQVKTRDGVAFNLIDAAKATRKPMFDTEKLVQQLNKQTGIKTTAKSVQPENMKVDLKANLIHFEFGKFFWTCNLKNYALSKDSAVRAKVPEPYWNDNFNELD